MVDINTNVFIDLVRAGLWETEVWLGYYEAIDWPEVCRLAKAHAVCGLVAAGLEHIKDIEIPQNIALMFVGATLQLEQRNYAMNHFITTLYDKLRSDGVDFVLVKGQGVAQCYERPMWRESGDIDLLLNNTNYEKGKALFKKLSISSNKEYDFNKEYQVNIDDWCVELHGSLRCVLSAAVNKEADAIQWDICNNFNVRYWEIEGDKIPLPEENNDVLLIFSHFIKHFYRGELNVRQICDWCRLLWVYQESISEAFLEKHIRKMRLLTHWRVFGSFAVEYLGMPSKAMPLYSSDKKWSQKAVRICNIIMQTGKQGNIENNHKYVKSSLVFRKCISMWRRVNLLLRYSSIFFIHSFFFLPHVLFAGVKATIENGNGR